ncbi:MAG TPA: hypothetical protein DDW83_02555, partial [Peptococcaceae bacterium]|nr:hypothetical protein [Peptococcaceae bacterium]
GVYPYRRLYGRGWYGYCISNIVKEKRNILSCNSESREGRLAGRLSVHLETDGFPRKGDYCG